MADAKQLARLKKGFVVWNTWRVKNPRAHIDLSRAQLSQIDLNWIDFRRVNLSHAKLIRARLRNANLEKADLRGAEVSRAKLEKALLGRANLEGANASGANLREAQLQKAVLRNANLEGADVSWANLVETNFAGANLKGADLHNSFLMDANLQGANLEGANLELVHLENADLSGANLHGASLSQTDLTGANLSGADLREANLWGALMMEADLMKALLERANLAATNLAGANLSEANLEEANLTGTNLWNANLSGANLTKANLRVTSLVSANIDKVRISGSSIYGIGVWDLEGEFEEQKDLIVTNGGQPKITVDNIKVAQFIYLILNNEEIRDVINTLTSKSVLILGRFAVPERKAILDALRNSLREYNLLPIVFDFDRPTDKDFTETIKTLAGLSYFVIADITNPKSSPLELQAMVPDYQIPFVPIIQEGESPFAMMVDLQKKYNWVLDTLSYKSADDLIKVLKPAIIEPAIQKHNELRLIKAREPKIRSANDFIDDKGLDNQSNSVAS